MICRGKAGTHCLPADELGWPPKCVDVSWAAAVRAAQDYPPLLRLLGMLVLLVGAAGTQATRRTRQRGAYKQACGSPDQGHVEHRCGALRQDPRTRSTPCCTYPPSAFLCASTQGVGALWHIK